MTASSAAGCALVRSLADLVITFVRDWVTTLHLVIGFAAPYTLDVVCKFGQDWLHLFCGLWCLMTTEEFASLLGNTVARVKQYVTSCCRVVGWCVEGTFRLSGTISDLLILNLYLLAITFLGTEAVESSYHIQHQEKSGENLGELVVYIC